MTERCRNCGEAVSDDYARVFSTDDEPGVDCCPECPDIIRGASGRPRERKGKKTAGGST